MRRGEIKSPLRYPGGKSRAVNQIAAMMPDEFAEYREPFVGGGSFFIHLRQRHPHLPIWINDLNRDLHCFWKHAQSDLDSLVAAVTEIRNDTTDGQNLFSRLTAEYESELSEFARAVRFFVLNRVTFSGTVDSGGYSQQAFDRRFTASSIERLRELTCVLAGVKITNLDYTELLMDANEDVLSFSTRLTCAPLNRNSTAGAGRYTPLSTTPLSRRT
jgi:DNA adenine methylase